MTRWTIKDWRMSILYFKPTSRTFSSLFFEHLPLISLSVCKRSVFVNGSCLWTLWFTRFQTVTGKQDSSTLIRFVIYYELRGFKALFWLKFEKIIHLSTKKWGSWLSADERITPGQSVRYPCLNRVLSVHRQMTKWPKSVNDVQDEHLLTSILRTKNVGITMGQT